MSADDYWAWPSPRHRDREYRIDFGDDLKLAAFTESLLDLHLVPEGMEVADLWLTEGQMRWLINLPKSLHPCEHEGHRGWQVCPSHRRLTDLLNGHRFALLPGNEHPHELTVFLGRDLRFTGELRCPWDTIEHEGIRPCGMVEEDFSQTPPDSAVDPDGFEDFLEEWRDEHDHEHPWKPVDICWPRHVIEYEGLYEDFVDFRCDEATPVTNPLKVHFVNDGSYDESALVLWPARENVEVREVDVDLGPQEGL